MTIRTLAPLTLFAAILAGCSSNPGTKSEPVAVTGTVLFADGKPVKDVTLNIFPNTSDQLPASAALKADGKFSVKLVPGKYTYAFEGSAAGLKAIPAAYQQNDSAHAFDVPAAGGDISLKVGG